MKLKKLLITSLVAGLLALSACGITTTQKSDSKEINKSEILSKMVEVDRAYKSAEVVMKNIMNINTSEQKVVFDVNADMQIALEPLQAYVSMEVQSPETKDALKVNTYIKDGFSYVNTELTPQLKDVWVKTVYDEKQFGAVINRANSSDYTQFFKSVERDNEIKEVENTYEINYVKDKIDFKTISTFLNSANISGVDLNEETLRDTKVDKIAINYVLDKASYEIKSVKLNIVLSQASNSANKVEMNSDITYKSFNKLTEIKVPEEILSKAVTQ